MPAADALDELLGSLPAVGLDELDRRASLLRRTDTKYVLDREGFAKLLGKLGGDHQVLEIDGRRRFGYESMYFDTPDLRCFRDHVEGSLPRFKARTRLYRDTGQCTFEVKLKIDRGETDKRQIDHSPQDVDRIGTDALQCLMEALRDIGMNPPEAPLEPSLRTTFTRVTLAPKNGRERTTCDLLIELQRPGKGRAKIRDGLVLVETKTEHGDGPADRVLREMGAEPLSFSKYRTGIALLAKGARDPDSPTDGERLFVLENPAPGRENLSSI
jgi:hypothetical protein